MPTEKNGEVVQLYVLAVQDEFFGAGNHVGQHPLNQPLRIGRVVVGHMLGKPFGIESVLNQRTCIPQSFQRAFFAGHFDTFCNESYSFVFSFQIKKFYILLQQYEDTT